MQEVHILDRLIQGQHSLLAVTLKNKFKLINLEAVEEVMRAEMAPLRLMDRHRS